jgi:hypothetical protein
MGKSLKEQSKLDWFSTGDENLSLNQINTGAILRIADATELMAKDRIQMEVNLAWYEKRYDELKADNKRMAKRIAAYQGHLNRLKKKWDGKILS